MSNNTHYSAQNSYPWNNYPPDSWNPMRDYRVLPVEIVPMNLNLTVNSNRSFRVYQKEKIFNTPFKQIVIPEVDIRVTMDEVKKNNNFNKPHWKRNNNRYNNNNYRNSNFSNNSQFKPPRKSNNRFYSDGSSQTRPSFKPKIIEFDMSTSGGKKSIESFLGKLFGLEKDEKETKIEAPISKELDFDMSKEYSELPMKVNTLDDLIALSDFYDDKNEHMFGFNMKRLNIIKNSLIKLNEIIGMNEVKDTITKKLITYLQGLGDMDDMNHIVIQAPPGYGKTMLGYHLSEIFYKLGLIKVPVSDNKSEEKYTHPFTGEKIDFPFIVAKRKDMIGEYVGQTAPKVEKMVNKALGGVLFIDEAYSLGSSGRVSYSEECINTLNQLLSEKAGQFICIIAGYKENLKESFFINPGLRRRFRMVFEIKKYNETQLAKIFCKMVNDKEWKLTEDLTKNSRKKLNEFMKTNQELFKYCGGDMESLLQNVRDAHSTRVFGMHPKTKKIISMNDMNEGLELYKKSNDRNDRDVMVLNSLYI